MTGYSEYNGVSIRHRSSGFDVPLGTAPYVAFVNFVDIDEAKAFIKSGRKVDGHVVYDIHTQTPVAA